MLLTRQKSDARSSKAFSSIQFSSVQFRSERANRAVAKFGRGEVSNGLEEKCNSPLLVVKAMNEEESNHLTFFGCFFFPLANLIVTQGAKLFPPKLYF